MKHRYRISALGYGAEVVVGTVRPSFVQYWAPIVEEEGDMGLIDHLLDDEDDRTTEIDPVLDYQGEWYDIHDLERLISISTDSSLVIQEIDEDGNDLDTEELYVELRDACQLYCRECYMQNTEAEGQDNCEPVLVMQSNEKGCFWEAFLELEEPIDTRLFGIGILETNLCELVDSVYYNGEPLELDYDGYDTIGKSYSAAVGWMNLEYHETEADFDMEEWQDYLKELESE